MRQIQERTNGLGLELRFCYIGIEDKGREWKEGSRQRRQQQSHRIVQILAASWDGSAWFRVSWGTWVRKLESLIVGGFESHARLPRSWE